MALTETDHRTLSVYIGDLVDEVHSIIDEHYEGEQVDWAEVWGEHLVLVAIPRLPSLTSSTTYTVAMIQRTVRAIVERN